MNEGEEWKVHRAFIQGVLRDLVASNVNTMEDKLSTVSQNLIAAITNNQSRPFDPFELLIQTAANVVAVIFVGKQFQLEESNFKEFSLSIRGVFQNLPGVDAFLSGPLIRLLANPLNPRYNALVRNKKRMYRLVEESLREHKESFDETAMRDFMDAYLSERKRINANGGDTEKLFDGKIEIFKQ